MHKKKRQEMDNCIKRIDENVMSPGLQRQTRAMPPQKIDSPKSHPRPMAVLTRVLRNKL